MTTTTTRPPAAGFLRHQANSSRLPAWLRIALWGWGNADQHGHARAYPGELRAALGLNARDVSRALSHARDRGLIDAASTASCIVMPGHSVAPCEASHRDAR